jgi:hypothetical protein
LQGSLDLINNCVLNKAPAMAKAMGRQDEGTAMTQLASLVKSEINSTPVTLQCPQRS